MRPPRPLANTERFRLNRGGNQQTNAALHRIAITQMRMHPDAKTFITRRAFRPDQQNERPSASSNSDLPTSSTEPCSPTPNTPQSRRPLDIGETRMRYLKLRMATVLRSFQRIPVS